MGPGAFFSSALSFAFEARVVGWSRLPRCPTGLLDAARHFQDMLGGSSETLRDIIQTGVLAPLGPHERKPLIQQATWSSLTSLEHVRRWETVAPPRERFRRLCQAAPHAGAWLQVPACPALGLAFSPRDFQLLCRRWLGVPLFRHWRLPSVPPAAPRATFRETTCFAAFTKAATCAIMPFATR